MVNEPRFTDGMGLCGTYECGDVAVARVLLEAHEYDYHEHDTYLGADVWVGVCKRHKAQVETDYHAALEHENQRNAERAEAQREVDELEAALAEARAKRNRI